MLKAIWQAITGRPARATRRAYVEVPSRCGMVRYEWREVNA